MRLPRRAERSSDKTPEPVRTDVSAVPADTQLDTIAYELMRIGKDLAAVSLERKPVARRR